MEDRELMDFYLHNQDAVFKTWYEKKVSREIGIDEGKLTGAIPPLEDIIEKFKEWCADNIQILKKIVCEEFNYPQKKLLIEDSLEVAMLLLPLLYHKVDFPYEVVAMIILLGCDRLCAEIE